MKRVVVFALMALALAACAPQSRVPQVDAAQAALEADRQRELAVREDARLWTRLDRVEFRVRAGAADLCGKKTIWRYGLDFTTLDRVRDNLGRDFARAWQRVFNITNEASVYDLVEGAPAAKVLHLQDRILQVEGVNVPQGLRADDVIDNAIKKVGPDGVLHMRIRRGDEVMDVAIPGVRSCDYPVLLRFEPEANAAADGRKIYINSGIIDLTRTDDELALVIGHELAHNTMKHMDAKAGNAIAAGIVGLAISVLTGVDVTRPAMDVGGALFSQEFEAEADYVGVYYAARGGYDVARAADFWRRMAAQHPSAIHLAGGSHPSTAKRFLAVEMAAKEVAQKRLAGALLVPEMKKVATAAPVSDIEKSAGGTDH